MPRDPAASLAGGEFIRPAGLERYDVRYGEWSGEAKKLPLLPRVLPSRSRLWSSPGVGEEGCGSAGSSGEGSGRCELWRWACRLAAAAAPAGEDQPSSFAARLPLLERITSRRWEEAPPRGLPLPPPPPLEGLLCWEMPCGLPPPPPPLLLCGLPHCPPAMGNVPLMAPSSLSLAQPLSACSKEGRPTAAQVAACTARGSSRSHLTEGSEGLGFREAT